MPKLPARIVGQPDGLLLALLMAFGPADALADAASPALHWGWIVAAALLTVIATLGGYVAYAKRRSRKAEAFEDTIISGGDLKASSVFGSTGAQSVDSGTSSFQSDFSQVSTGAINPDEVDPVAEADVYMAYGRDGQAEEILKEALAKDASRQDVRLKLMEIFRERSDWESYFGLNGAAGSQGDLLSPTAVPGRAPLPESLRADSGTAPFSVAVGEPGTRVDEETGESEAGVVASAPAARDKFRAVFPADLPSSAADIDGILEVDFEFGEEFTATSVSPPVAGTSGSAHGDVELEQEFWNEIKDSTRKSDFEEFLDSFPSGRLAPVARMRLRKLEAEQPVERTVIRPEAPRDSTVVRTRPTKVTIRPMAPTGRAPGVDTAAADEARKAEEEQKRKQVEAEAAAAEQVRLKQELQRREAEEARAVERPRSAATEDEKREAEARRRQEVAERAKREAEERKRQEAESRAKREAESHAKREPGKQRQRGLEEHERMAAEAKVLREAEAMHLSEEEKSRKEAESPAFADVPLPAYLHRPALRRAPSASGPGEPTSSPLPHIPAPITDAVHFTVTAPMTVVPGRAFVMDLWAHVESARAEVLSQASEALAGRPMRHKSRGAALVERGRTLSVQISVPDFNFLDDDTIMWTGSTGNATFAMHVPQDVSSGHHMGMARLAVDGVQISRLHFEIEVGVAEGVAGQRAVRERRYRSAFASYASEDRNEVLARIQGMQKLLPDLDVFLDIASIRAGEHWAARLEEEIALRETFFLFWSGAASRSEWVAREWRAALRLKGIDGIDPVPLEPPQAVPPPSELAALHFNEWTLAYRTPIQ